MSDEAKPAGFTVHRRAGGGEAIGSDDDTEGQSLNVRRRPGEGVVGDDGDDTEGQMFHDPGAGRIIAQARENEIRRHLSRHELEGDARRPHRKEK